MLSQQPAYRHPRVCVMADADADAIVPARRGERVGYQPDQTRCSASESIGSGEREVSADGSRLWFSGLRSHTSFGAGDGSRGACGRMGCGAWSWTGWGCG